MAVLGCEETDEGGWTGGNIFKRLAYNEKDEDAVGSHLW